ncbi:hypothetical protein H0H92_013546 [Tricholoma furcatifolium]|nr:hypothetical protein H0H92_013546 [Tricholoma furcatifolium]
MLLTAQYVYLRSATKSPALKLFAAFYFGARYTIVGALTGMIIIVFAKGNQTCSVELSQIGSAAFVCSVSLSLGSFNSHCIVCYGFLGLLAPMNVVPVVLSFLRLSADLAMIPAVVISSMASCRFVLYFLKLSGRENCNRHGDTRISPIIIRVPSPAGSVARDDVTSHFDCNLDDISHADSNKNMIYVCIMQWTGGRAGGHHSFEDFHQPVLATYGAIRRHSNISLNSLNERRMEGVANDLSDMTYEEVVLRMVPLMFVAHEKRWVDTSLRNLTGDWLRRVEERFAGVNGTAAKPSVLQSYTSLDDPLPFVEATPERSITPLLPHPLPLIPRSVATRVPEAPSSTNSQCCTEPYACIILSATKYLCLAVSDFLTHRPAFRHNLAHSSNPKRATPAPLYQYFRLASIALIAGTRKPTVGNTIDDALHHLFYSG